MIVRSPWPDVVVPDVSITDYVLRHAERLRDRPSMIDGPTGRTLTFGQLADSIRRVATGLARRGFRKGDVFAIYSPNLPEYAVIFHAVASLGGINTTVNPLYTAGELAKQLKDSGARFLITVPPFLDKAKEAAAAAGVEEIYVFGTAEGARPFAELLEAPPSPPSVKINPREDVVVLPYSSGTTGLPKGVMLTHHNLVANLCQAEGFKDFDGFKDGDVVIAVLPFFHIYGMVVIMKLGLCQGATIVSMPRFDFQEFLTAVQKYRASILPLVPPIVLGMVKHPAVSQFDLSSVRLVFSGAAPLEGWYHTGDVGYVDPEGWFYIVDRTKELIKYKGMQVAPAELEALLFTHPAILDAAVIRKADEEAGEVPKAFVVLKPDAASKATTGEAIMAFVAERVAPHKRIRHLEFTEQIPKSPSGKILRRMLVQMEKERAS